jgi:GntR family transcriptional regulator, rspAB operon transcriptional repressor
MHRLGGEGFLKILPQKGTFVSEISHEEIDALMEYRLILERGAIYLAMGKISEREIQKLQGLKREMARLTREDYYLKLMELDSQFHWVIIQATRNPKLIDAYAQLSPHFKLIRFHNVLQRGRWSPKMDEEHARILQAIENRDTKAAEKVMTDHILRTKEEFSGNGSKVARAPVSRMFKL